MPTNNPLPSGSLEDFKDNAIILDFFVNSQENEYPDRFNRKRPTITGIIKEAFNVRTDISNMNETLIGQSRWDAVPKNTSLSLGGDNGALNKQAQALFNRTEMLKVQARETLRRTYQEAGLNLVEGSFEQGGTLNTITDILIEEKTGKVYSWEGTYPKVVPIGSTLESTGVGDITVWVDKSRNDICLSIDNLRTITGLRIGEKINLLGYYIDTPGVGNGVLYVSDDTTSADNGGTIFVTSDGVRIKRVRSLKLKASDFGVRGDWNGVSGTDNRARVEALIQASNSSQPWIIDLENVGVSTVQIDSKDNWTGYIKGSVFSIAGKPAINATDEKDTSGGLLPLFKITNCDKWKLMGGFLDNRYREAFWVENCNKFKNECDVLSSGLNNNLRPNYYRYCRSFSLRKFRHEATSEKPETGYYEHCNNINLWDCNNFKITDFEIEDTGSNGIYIGSNCRDFLISHFIISKNAMSGIQLGWSFFGQFPYRGKIGDGLINGNRADGIDVNNTNGSIFRTELTISGVITVNNGYNDDGSISADGSGIGTFANISHFDIIGCHTEDPARAGFYAKNCTNFNVIGGSIKKEKTINNAGEGLYIEGCQNWNISGISVMMASGKEALKLYGVLKNGVIGDNTVLKGAIAIPTPDANTTYDNVRVDGAIIETSAEIQGRIPFKNTKITSTANGLRAFKNVDNCNINALSGTGLIYSDHGICVNGGIYKGSNSGTYCKGFNKCVLTGGAEVIGGSGPASHWLSAVASQIYGGNKITATTGANSIRIESSCSKTVFFGNLTSGVESFAGSYDIIF